MDHDARTRNFETFLQATLEARTASERDRDYVDHKQWDDDEVDNLEARGQAPVVINKIKTKVNLLNGIQRQRRTDPKALPRTPQHEEDADSVTDAIRFVADNTDFELTSSAGFNDKIVWGYEAAIVPVKPENDDFEVQIEHIPPDRFYYDPYSRRLDFKDARFMGIVIWMDKEEGVETFPDKKADIEALVTTGSDSLDGETFEDKPSSATGVWVDRKTQRFRVCQEYFLKNGVWKEVYFTQNLELVDEKDSPYLDEHGDPTNPIEAQSAYIDRDNNRYGEVRSYIWPQQEINHRRSKAIYQLSVRQTLGEKGAVDDLSIAKQELARANGHVEINPGKRFELLDNNDQIAGQLDLYQDSKNDIDAIGANAALSGTQEQGLSGRAIQSLQQGGIAELGSLFDGHLYWEKRIYRQVWARIKQFWNAERWIRVTDNEDNLRWVTLNQPVTFGEILKERAEQGDQQAQQMLQQLIDDPRLNEVAMVRNNTTELDVDIVLTASVDYATIRQEQFDTMARLAQSYGPEEVPFRVMLKLSDMTNKKEVEDLLTPNEEEIDPAQQQAQAELAQMLAELEFRDRQAEVDKKEKDLEALEAKIRKDIADAEAQEIENAFVQTFGTTIDQTGPAVNIVTGA